MGQMHDATLMSDDFREMDGVVHARFGPLWLGSHFQPIYSVVHGRVVGHEALLRGLDADGHRVSPVEVFAACSGLQDIGRCDTLSRRAHLLNFVKARAQDQWLFLNVHVDAFLHGMEGDMASSKVGWLQGLQVRPEQIVIELLEDSIDRLAPLEQAVQQFKSHGFLIALDDFGAGHSNFDRVWRLKPDIVKLDRSMVVRAAKDAGTARMLGQLTSLLHECGALVLMEGVETYDEALLAMDCDVDLMQGYYFCRPQPMVQTGLSTPDQLTDLYKGMDLRRRAHQRAHKELIAPYVNAIGHAGVMLQAGHTIQEACESFLDLPGGQLCYLLDAEGRQIGDSVWRPDGQLGPHAAYLPMKETQGATWASRPYFRRALDAPGKVQVTRPYRTLQGRQLCFTVSSRFIRRHDCFQTPAVICGDVLLQELPDGSLSADNH